MFLRISVVIFFANIFGEAYINTIASEFDFYASQQILDKVIANRKKITSCQFSLKSERKTTKDNKIVNSGSFSMLVYSQGIKARMEKIYGQTHATLYRNCYEDKTLMMCNLKPYYALNPPDKVSEPYIVIYDFDGKTLFDKPFGDSLDYNIPNVQVLGLVAIASDSLFYNIESYFALNRETLGGLPQNCEVIKEDSLIKVTWSYKLPSKKEGSVPQYLVFNYWFEPDKDYIVRKVESTDSTYKMLETLNNNVVQDKKTGIWYPSDWTYECYRNNVLETQEKCTLNVTSINENIDEEIFTLKKLQGLEKGTYVHWKRKSQPPYKLPLAWDGTDIVSKGTADFKIVTEGIEAEKAKNRHFKILIINAVFILAIIASIAYRNWRKQKE
ncbi:MAG: hypothetical protein LBJ67_10410 [Planctomycetaceae bacterium]|jgi:hypothetical protein|nr:hypothetical protein [Planctomycetaceae bacterium]